MAEEGGGGAGTRVVGGRFVERIVHFYYYKKAMRASGEECDGKRGGKGSWRYSHGNEIG